jgi:hypothetical protein
MNAQALTDINVLTTRRNLAVRKLASLGQVADAGSVWIARQLRTFIAGADARAAALGARLVAMPGRPGAVIADVFLSMVADD